MKKTIPLIVFVAVCLIDFIAIYFKNQTVIYFVKPLLMVTLFWYYNTHKKQTNNYFLLGLFFSFLGDILLMGKGQLFFVLGLLFFLTAHVFYIILVSKNLIKIKLNQLVIASIPYVAFFIVLLNILYDSLGVMKIPVIIYAITISIFGVFSLLLYLQKKTKARLILVIGVVTFVISDTVLALNLFYKSQTYFPLLIMMTYVTAQFLICRFALNLNTKK